MTVQARLSIPALGQASAQLTNQKWKPCRLAFLKLTILVPSTFLWKEIPLAPLDEQRIHAASLDDAQCGGCDGLRQIIGGIFFSS